MWELLMFISHAHCIRNEFPVENTTVMMVCLSLEGVVLYTAFTVWWQNPSSAWR